MAKLPDLINKESLVDFTVEYRVHASRRMFRRGIHEDDVETVLENG